MNTINKNPVMKLTESIGYSIIPTDKKAETFVQKLAEIMQLEKVEEQGRKILVCVKEHERGEKKLVIPENDEEPILCILNPAENREMFNIQVERIAQAVVIDATNKGGMLIHGALCSHDGAGAIMAGPGTIGKSTASMRLPGPWISYCDDATIIIPDGNGGFRAHPWPTWSRFYTKGPGGSWKVEDGIQLNVIFFLVQSPNDFAIPVDKAHAKAMIIDTVEHVTRSNMFTAREKQGLVKNFIKRANVLSQSVPAFQLHISLTGEFWKEMEKTLKSVILQRREIEEVNVRLSENDYVQKRKNGNCLYFVYRGVSMNPTFIEPEMMTVIPYDAGSRIKKGDVICYKTETREDTIVHRIIEVKDSKIRTKGDSNANPDPYTIDRINVIGRVCESHRDGRMRRIYGGLLGVAEMHLVKVRRPVMRFISRLLHCVYHGLSRSGIFIKLLPKVKRIELAVFERKNNKYPKLIFSGRKIGMYDPVMKGWKIRRPYRLFVNESRLPGFERSLRLKTEK